MEDSEMVTPHTDNTVTALAPEVLDEAVRRIVRIAKPERVILFGSAARGEMGPNSDVDLLVVKSGTYSAREVALQIRRGLRDLRQALDIVVATPEQLERYGDCFALVYYEALREGRELYAAG
jgi:uncharacterized protein